MRKKNKEDNQSNKREELFKKMDDLKREILHVKANEEELGEVETKKRILELLQEVKSLKLDIQNLDNEEVVETTEIIREKIVDKDGKEKEVRKEIITEKKEEGISSRTKEKEVVVKEKVIEGEFHVDKYRRAWIGVILTFGLGDIFTTWLAFQGNATEGNPFLAPILEANFWLIIPFKILVIILIFFISWYFVWEYENDSDPSHERVAFSIAYIMIVVGIILSIYNIGVWYTYK